jgi:hypothetical protein
MNIFFLSMSPTECAKLYCDQHVIKILLEVTQMLYTAWHFSTQVPLPNPPRTKSGSRGYKVAHPSHPMCLWVRSSRRAYTWTVQLGMALAIEYHARFHKCHACTKHILWLSRHVPRAFHLKKSPKAYYDETHGIPECMPPEHHQPNLVRAYQSYYKTKTFARWRK